MPGELVHVELQGAVARIELDSPHNRNALSAAMLGQLTAALQTGLQDPQVRVLVLGHRGPAFCSGADLREQAATFRQGEPGPGVGALVPLFRLMLDSDKPLVARVGGPARAGGVGLVGACDLVVATTQADFATGEVRLGVAPAVLSVVVLPKLGRAAAARLFLTGAVVGAEEACRMGLVTQVVPETELEAATSTLIDQLLLAEPGALAAAKAIIRLVPGLERDRAFSEMAELSRELFASAGAQEGMAAFLERRPPSWVAQVEPAKSLPEMRPPG
ncbi:MAG: enoyl-CoA hydratase-related protein [Candidatus Dormibacteria bacterium]